MALFGLVVGGKIIETAAAAFPVNAAFVWTSDISAVTPTPQVGWAATETNGAWSFAAPVAPPIDARPAARAALTASDITILRCYEHAVAVPADWAAYRAALRVLVSGPATTGPLPPMPAYPVGT
jgi:hypothetical protein